MASGLRIHLLGSLEVWRDGQLLSPDAWPGRKARRLFLILLTHRHRTVSSDELLEWLWPTLSPKAARNSLWVAVSQLRRLLEPEAHGRGSSSFVLTEPSGYRFDPAGRCDIDVEAFLGQARAGQALQQCGEWVEAIEACLAATARYRGDYLAQYPYEDWAMPTRERLREVFAETQTALAACHLALGRYQEALADARAVLDNEPWRESAWRLVMEAHYRAGEQDQALRAFARCRALLAEELGVDPLPETLALHQRILQIPVRPPSWPRPALPPALSLHLPFVGREREWALLSGFLQQALDGQGRVALLAGEPGIGKTRLLEELAGLSTARGARVLFGRCHELEPDVAYAPILDALRALLPTLAASPSPCPPASLAALAELLPELREMRPDLPAHRPLPPDEERARLLAAVAQVFRRCAQSEPLVLLLDDLHWADPSTLQVVHYLARQVADQALLLVGAYRSTRVDSQHPVAAMRGHLARQGTLVELPISAFQEDDVILLLRLLGSQEPGDALARRLYRKTEGHPYFLAEVLRTFIQEEWMVRDAEGRWHLAATSGLPAFGRDGHAGLDEPWLLPPNIRALVLGRLDRLSEDDRLFLDHAAIIGREFSLPLMAHLLEQPETELAVQAERLCRRGFLRPCRPDHYAFGHDLMRRAAYEALSEPRRRLLHRQAAGALLGLGAPTATVATHYAASDRPWLALEQALAAADQAARVVAYDEAIAWCQKGMDIAEAHPEAVPPGFRTRLHLEWRTLWYYQGDLERTLTADWAALTAARREGNAAAELQALWHLAHDETQVAAGGPSGAQSQALALARGLGDPAALARSLARLGSDSGFLATPSERQHALDALDQAVSLARQVGDPALLHYVLCELWGVGRLPQARAALEEALTLVRRLGDQREEAGTLAKLADLLARQGELAAAAEYARQGMALAEQAGSPAYGAWNRRALGQALVALGKTDEGLAHLQEAARTFEALSWRAMLAGTLLRLGLAYHPAASRPVEQATAALERVLILSRETHEVYEAAYALALLGELRLRQSDREAGCEALAEAAALAPRIGLPWHRGGTLLHIAAGRLLLGEMATALTTADEAIRLAEEENLHEVRAQGLRLRERLLIE
ncbi:MAG TPA: BTAD domain-containing putative transcriptional regulator [Anaerolineae bacterium]|nr:BTAD domain-containing putative transcriptional regulator [Anaerolineae bacterium]